MLDPLWQDFPSGQLRRPSTKAWVWMEVFGIRRAGEKGARDSGGVDVDAVNTQVPVRNRVRTKLELSIWTVGLAFATVFQQVQERSRGSRETVERETSVHVQP